MAITRATPSQSSGAPLTYTGSFSDLSAAAVVSTQIFSAASNVNGAYVEYIGMSSMKSNSGGTNVTILAKATAPANASDGDVIFRASTGAGNAAATMLFEPMNVQQVQRVKIPAGKGLYLNQSVINSAPANTCEKTVLYTLL